MGLIQGIVVRVAWHGCGIHLLSAVGVRLGYRLRYNEKQNGHLSILQVLIVGRCY